MDRYRDALLLFSIPFGLVLGSFLNVCIFRLPRNCMSIVRPRSRCTKCLAPIAWYDNLPVASYLLLGGKCRGCRKPISARYPLVELLTAGLVAASAYQHLFAGGDEFERIAALGMQVYVVACLVTASLIDIDFYILPEEITWSGTVISIAAVTAFPFLHADVLGANATTHGRAFLSAGLGTLVGAGIIFGTGVLGKLLFRKEAMGMGDVFYFAFLGAYLGWRKIVLAFMLACVFGALIGIVRLAFWRKHYLPFGPFLSLGALTMIFFSEAVERWIHWYQSLFQGPRA